MTITCNEGANFNGKRIITVGRFSYEKGYDNLVNAWALVKRGLVKDRNIEAFAERMCHLIEDKELHARMRPKAIEYSKKYEVDNIMAQWTSLFDELMASKKKS